MESRTADAVTAHALFGCLVREVSGVDGQTHAAGPYLVARLARLGPLLRARVAGGAAGPTPRFAGPVEELTGDGWAAIGWRRLAELTAAELRLATGRDNPEFTAQVTRSHTALTAIHAATSPDASAAPAPRGAVPTPAADGIAAYLGSEQSLRRGHPRHPSPKDRQTEPSTWLRYAPEAGARFPLRWLAVRRGAVAAGGRADAFAPVEALGPAVPEGYVPLPVHPWQWELLADRPALGTALTCGDIVDLGEHGPDAVPTSSVRTVYLPDADLFCKFSLDVRLTNCVRKNAWYELAGAVALGAVLGPYVAETAARFPGFAFLTEPAFRSVRCDDGLHESLGVIVREGVGGAAGSPVLAAALIEDPGLGRWARLPLGAGPDDAAAWWDAYLAALVPPVLHLFHAHGVVTEPHLQNVLVTLDEAGRPAGVILRDLEGTKLVAERHPAMLAALHPRVAEGLGYDAERGWNRVMYCLFVNHLAELAAAIDAAYPGLETRLWAAARERVIAYAATAGDPPELRALVAGVPLPAKCNLRTRWERLPDRAAGYIPVRNPLADHSPVSALLTTTAP
ncbi:MAG: IucA/IucC family protein [Streptosporangiales bacterium]|nr:IucA/IucC family protein [Streptosporangiales bacterium]